MKILFTFSGLPHYHNRLLSRLNEKAEILVCVPESKSSNIGASVYESSDGITFRIIRLQEYRAVYGKMMLRGLDKLILDQKPDIVVTIWPYIIGTIMNARVYDAIRKTGARLCFKDIPFRHPKFKDGLSFKKFPWLNESLLPLEKNIKDVLRRVSLTVLRKFIYARVDAFLCYTADGYDVFPSYGVPKDKIFLTYNSPDTDSFFESARQAERMPLILPENRHRIIHMGRLVKWKRVDLLIKAFKIVRMVFPDAELLILGGGPEQESLKKYAQELGLQDSARFPGASYDRIEIARYMRCSSLYVLAGMGGLSINEAMAYGKPVICSVCDGTERHLLRDGYNGYYFKEADAGDLAEKIIRILGDQNLSEKMGENSLKIIKEEINIDSVVGRYLGAFKGLARV